MSRFLDNKSSVKHDFFDHDIKSNFKFLSDCISNKKILVIGGAGTIGSNYIKQILHFKPKTLMVVDQNENALTELTRDLRSSNLLDYNPVYLTYPINLLSETFDKIFQKHHFDIISNFSAHKHVRSEKDILSIEALIKNNIYGAIKLLKLCEINQPDYFFSVSTDKATNPVNIMGASKLIMEKLILSKMNNFRVSTARFANVSFSNGSLLEGFKSRINKSQPLSCPSNIKRFFVSPEQSGKICMLATFLGNSGNIFFPKLDFNNDQIYFKDIAIDYLKYKGFKPIEIETEMEAKNFNINNSKKYPIYFFKSDTSGEKEYEEFFSVDEEINLIKYDSLGFVNSSAYQLSFDKILREFNLIFENHNSTKNDIIKLLRKYIPNFSHIEKGKNLDSKM